MWLLASNAERGIETIQTHTPFSAEAWETFAQALSMAGSGLVGIFVFMGLFTAIILGFEKLFPGDESGEQQA